MTCLVALENSSLDEQVTMTATGVSGVTDGGANISSQLDEVFTMEQCLYAIMVASANDIALQVAEHVGRFCGCFCTDNEYPGTGAWLHQYCLYQSYRSS